MFESRDEKMKQLNYCCICGKNLVFKTLLDGSKEKYCPKCDHVFFDTPISAVIVAVTSADRVLLTRSIGWKHPYWGLIAGHVESGETAEDAAIRETREEVGLEIFDLKILKSYVKSQMNAYSDLLMIGFLAKAKRTRIKRCRELDNAAWFKLHEPLP